MINNDLDIFEQNKQEIMDCDAGKTTEIFEE